MSLFSSLDLILGANLASGDYFLTRDVSDLTDGPSGTDKRIIKSELLIAMQAGLTPTSRTIDTTSPLTGGGDLSTNRTFAIPPATGSVSGHLTNTDWTTFNDKAGKSGSFGDNQILLSDGSGGVIKAGLFNVLNDYLLSTGSGPVVDMGNGTLGFYDFGTEPISLHWVNRTTHDSTGVPSIDWTNRILLDSNTGGPFTSVGWDSRQLADASSQLSLDWNSRVLCDAAGVTVASWDSGGIDAIFKYTPADPSHWAGSPLHLKEAVDRIAALLYSMNSGMPI